MLSRDPEVQLTQSFLDHVAALGITDAQAAALIGISRQEYSETKHGKRMPALAFTIGVIHADLASNFADVVEPTPKAAPPNP